MCIIIAKEKGLELPNEEILNTCWENNNDGAGIMYHKPGMDHIRILKGFMDFKDLLESIKELKLTKEDSIVYHFRWTTHGGTTPGNTHPFPITDKINFLKALNVKTDIGIAHNGIIPIKPSDDKISDTMEFIKSYLADLKKNGALFHPQSIKLMKNETGFSKYAFLNKNGNIQLIGKGWVIDKETGLKFSNSGYKETRSYYVSAWWEKEMTQPKTIGTGSYYEIKEIQEIEDYIFDLQVELSNCQLSEMDRIGLTSELECYQVELEKTKERYGIKESIRNWEY